MEIEEKGTKFLEEIDVDEKQDVEIFRVPSHNNVSGAHFYHDFKKVSDSTMCSLITERKHEKSEGQI